MTERRLSEPGGSAQQRYDELAERDRAQRQANRGRSTIVFLGTIILTATVTFGALALANNRFDAWQSSLPGQTVGGHQIFPLSTSVQLTAAFTFFAALGMGRSLWGRRQSTENYRLGAAGERATADRLAPLLNRGWVLLHDRTIPGRRENIDHIAVGPPGIAVIDAKNWSGRVVVGAATLKVNGRDKAAVLAQLERQHNAIALALASEDLGSVEIRRIVCFHRADIERQGSKKNPARPGGVRVCDPGQLVDAVCDGPVVLTPAIIEQIAMQLDRVLRPAVNHASPPVSSTEPP